MEISTFGFLGVHSFEQGAAVRGAILVTTLDTKPLEFRITVPVRPQSFQAILYGELLNEHISLDLISLPLLNALQNKPDLICVRDDLLLGINSKQEIPTIRMARADAASTRKGIKVQLLNAVDASHPSAEVYTSKKFVDSLQMITGQLQAVFSQRDLIEPFERVERACADVHKRETGNR